MLSDSMGEHPHFHLVKQKIIIQLNFGLSTYYQGLLKKKSDLCHSLFCFIIKG